MNRQYSSLRCAMQKKGITNKYLAEKFEISDAAVSYRFSGRTQWRVNEMYSILKMLGEPREMLGFYFPPGGFDPVKPYRYTSLKAV